MPSGGAGDAPSGSGVEAGSDGHGSDGHGGDGHGSDGGSSEGTGRGRSGGGGGGGQMLEVGTVVRPHGLRGEVVLSLATNRTERAAVGSVLTDADGRTHEIVQSFPHRGRFVVRFDGVTSVEAAEALRGLRLLAAPLADPDALWVHELIGVTALLPDGSEIGRVVAVQANPASDLLVLDGGALVPLRFVVASVPGTSVTVDVPDGLLDL